MELWIGIFILLAVVVVWFLRKFGSTQATAQTLLSEYDAFERSGLPEEERLFKLLATRGGWRSLPHPFLHELASRLENKENVIRFIALSERHQLDRSIFAQLAKQQDVEMALFGVACLLASFGNRLQDRGSLNEAEFVQLLALRIQPNQHFTALPLAVTYYRMKRYSDAAPLFKHGLSLFEKAEKEAKWIEHLPSPTGLFGSKSDMEELGQTYRKMYEECLKASTS